MIPKLLPENTSDQHYVDFFKALKQTGFSGDIEYSYSSRLAVATDNSVYQKLPQGVILPKNINDLQLMLKLANTKQFEDIKFSPRGGGTGTNGQSLTYYIIVDMSRHMRAISDFNEDDRTVYVQPGVIKDYLNKEIKKYNLFFSPELSTSNRATFGGMISTDASGQGSLKYGKTSRHVLEVDMVLNDGSLVTFKPVSGDDLKAKLKLQNMEGNIYRTIYEIVTTKEQEIKTIFPDLNRFLTGYDLKHVYNKETDTLDISRIICGSEGTLGFIVGAKLDLTKIPTFRALVNIKYDSFDSALRHAPVMVKAKALSVETVDSKVLNLAREDIVWHSVKDLITDVPNAKMEGINIVEFAGLNEKEEMANLKALTDTLDKTLKDHSIKGIIGYQVCTNLPDILAIYNMRKKAVGLLGNAHGNRKPIAFTEDTVVPPDHLADYIVEFRALLDSYHLTYGMFGHVDSGVLHVRPALDLCNPEEEKTLRAISDKVVKLTAKYGGIMWGEHGRGHRSEYGPEYFGILFNELRKVKAAFDPLNRINPGKICTPYGNDEDKLVSVDDKKRGAFDRQIPVNVRDSFKEALSCNGNGLCFSFDTSSPMCPTYKYMGDRRQSPKGRAGLVREWLRQLELEGVNPLLEEQKLMNGSFSFKDLAKKCVNSLKKNDDDFSHEVMDALSVCLACKACASQCPIKVDVPDFRSRFFNLYYGRYLRPMGDIFVRTIEDSAPLMAKMPGVINSINSLAPIKFIAKKTLGFVDIPRLSNPNLNSLLTDTNVEFFDFEKAKEFTPSEIEKYVIIVQDTFTSSYDAAVVADMVKLMSKLEKRPLLLPLKPNGKALHIRGYLKQFAHTAADTADFLNKVAALNIPMVGVDPAMVLCYRDEYKKILKESRGNFEVLLIQEWLLKNLDKLEFKSKANLEEFYLLAHCTEKTLKPTTHGDWQKIFKAFNLKLTPIPVGCCGMAGLYGHTAVNEERSNNIYKQNWAPVFAKYPIGKCLVTGYSCREQVRLMEGVVTKHPLQALLEFLD
ncbi:MAG: FAD-binding and (Fe-S)-binding domain-containing protein [Ruminobacter sp.]|nr:FAD-binding and (Fe-S)-binding domain-containing protein [Ruminobacter sp.]